MAIFHVLLQLFVISFIFNDMKKTINSNDKERIGAVFPYQAVVFVIICFAMYKNLAQ